MRDCERGGWSLQADGLPMPAGDGAGADVGPVAGDRPECIDLRALPSPQPLERGLAAAEALPRGGRVVLLTPLLPMPLLQLLDTRGFTTESRLLSDGSARVVVRRD